MCIIYKINFMCYDIFLVTKDSEQDLFYICDSSTHEVCQRFGDSSGKSSG